MLKVILCGLYSRDQMIFFSVQYLACRCQSSSILVNMSHRATRMELRSNKMRMDSCRYITQGVPSTGYGEKCKDLGGQLRMDWQCCPTPELCGMHNTIANENCSPNLPILEWIRASAHDDHQLTLQSIPPSNQFGTSRS